MRSIAIADSHAPPATNRLEVEWTFEATDLHEVEQWLRSKTDLASGSNVVDESSIDIVDSYFDTPDWRFFRSRHALRIRRSDATCEATLKSLEPSTGALSRRREITQALESADADGLAAADGPVAERVRAVAGSRPIRQLFAVRTRRHSFALRLPDGDCAMIALDDSQFLDTGGREIARTRRAEIEAVGEAESIALRAFADELCAACALTPAASSKFEFGLSAAELRPTEVPDFGPTSIDDTMDAGAVAQAVLRLQLAIYLANEPAARLGDDPDALHEMRVATRRLRAGLSFFADALPARGRRLRATLRWIGRALGAVRDLDVQIEQIEAWTPASESPETATLRAFAEALGARRRTARTRMLRVLDSRRAEQAAAAVAVILRRHPVLRSPATRLPIREFAAPRLVRLWRRIRKIADRLDRRSSPDAFHETRIRCKRLRYALEFVSEPYGHASRPLLRGLVEIQDLLGTMQDSRVAITQVLDVAASGRPRLGRDAARQLGGVVERYARRAARAPSRFAKTYRRLRGEPWKSFQRALRSNSEDIH
ncbi:MAG: CHAD domain-containing protein [Planctomycetes bacterium]|nr:CHAD domain-containing protein [Planctomycetota bacterium]MBI3845487.1 CHAD domain-containing protein [Planctomycetota bacterium]